MGGRTTVVLSNLRASVSPSNRSGCHPQKRPPSRAFVKRPRHVVSYCPPRCIGACSPRRRTYVRKPVTQISLRHIGCTWKRGAHRDNKESRVTSKWPKRMGHAPQAHEMGCRTLDRVYGGRWVVRRRRPEALRGERRDDVRRQCSCLVGADRPRYTVAATRSTTGSTAVSPAGHRSRYGSVRGVISGERRPGLDADDSKSRHEN